MVTNHACTRARELAALEPDGELSQLDRVRLTAHTGRCAGCREFRRDVAAATTALRSAPLELPSRQVLLPHRRRLRLRAVQVSAAAAVLLVSAGIGALAPLRAHPRTPSLPSARFPRATEQTERQEQRSVRLDRIKPLPVGLAGGAQ
jgi:hypothetical protein